VPSIRGTAPSNAAIGVAAADALKSTIEEVGWRRRCIAGMRIRCPTRTILSSITTILLATRLLRAGLSGVPLLSALCLQALL